MHLSPALPLYFQRFWGAPEISDSWNSFLRFYLRNLSAQERRSFWLLPVCSVSLMSAYQCTVNEAIRILSGSFNSALFCSDEKTVSYYLRKGFLFLKCPGNYYKIYQCMWHLLIVLLAYFSEVARRKDNVIWEAGSFFYLPKRVFGTWKMFFIFQNSVCYFEMGEEKATTTTKNTFLVLFLFYYVFWKLLACWLLLPLSVYSV